MVRYCSYCKKICSNENGRSAHMFPKNEQLRAKWMAACKFEAHINDNISALRLCSDHFSNSSFRITSENYPKKLLKSDAIPSIFKNKKAKKEKESKFVDKINNELKYSDHNYNKQGPVTKSNHKELSKTEINNDVHSSIITSNKNLNDDTFIHQQTVADEIQKNILSKSKHQPSKPKRKIWGPRNTLQMSIEHFSTPQKVTQNLQIIHNDVAKKNQIINSLRLKNYRLEKKIDKLNELIQQLKDKNK